MSTLKDYLALIERFLDHGRQHLDANDWKIFTRRLVGTPLEQGYSVQERWTADQMIKYYWPRLHPDEQDAFLREHGHTSRRRRRG